MMYQSMPYKVYESKGKLIHFNENSLELTEITSLHRALLINFSELRSKENILGAYRSNPDVDGAINELIELGLIGNGDVVSFEMQKYLYPKIRAFRIVLTETCNLSCIECFVTKHCEKMRVMKKKTLKKIISECILYGKEEQMTFHFFGGEPLICFNNIKLAVEMLQQAVLAGIIIQPVYRITTNLTLLTSEIIAFFTKYNFHVGVSVDGPKEINDKLRVYRDGSGTYDDVARNYKQLIENGVNAHVLITPHPKHLDKFLEYLKKVLLSFSMRTITINTPFHFETLKWSVPGDRYAKLLVGAIGIAKEFGVEVDSAASPPLVALSGEMRRESPCSLSCDRIMASVDPDGSVSFCAQRWNSALTVPIEKISLGLHIPLMRTEDCLGCEARNICGGPCPAFQKISNDSIDENKCLFMRSLLREVINNLDLFEIA